MVNWNFNHKTGILESKFSGEVYLKEIVEYIINTKENKSYPRKLKIITDAMDANFVFTVNDLELIIDENNKSLEQYVSIIDAIVIADPKSTALSMLYQRLDKNDKYKFNIFSTEDAAKAWLDKY